MGTLPWIQDGEEMKIKPSLCWLLLVAMFLLPGCTNGQSPSAPSSSVFMASSLSASLPPSTGENLDNWIGTYHFYEYGGNYINMDYRIFIFKENQQYFADIFIDGHMTMVRDRAEVTGNAESIKLTFIKKYPDGDDESYHIGDLLMSFRYQDSTLYTDWGELEPMLLENNDSGVYFEKVSDELVPQGD